MPTAKYVNAKSNERILHGANGAVEPGGVIELDDRQVEIYTEAGYTLKPVPQSAPPKAAAKKSPEA